MSARQKKLEGEHVIPGLAAGQNPESRGFDACFLDSGCRFAAPE
jgi:hypothetical protein